MQNLRQHSFPDTVERAEATGPSEQDPSVYNHADIYTNGDGRVLSGTYRRFGVISEVRMRA